jgi:hypothetical protein
VRYLYTATMPPGRAKRAALQRFVRTFFGGSLGEIVTALAISESFRWTMAFKSAVVLANALAAIAVMRRARASLRHALLAAGFAVLMALPLAVVLLPPATIPVAVADGVLWVSEPPEMAREPRAGSGVPHPSDLKSGPPRDTAMAGSLSS